MGGVCTCINKQKRKINQDPNASLDCQESDITVGRSINHRTIKNSIIIHKATLQSKKNKFSTDPNSLTSMQIESTQQEALVSAEQTNNLNIENKKTEQSIERQQNSQNDLEQNIKNQPAEKDSKEKKNDKKAIKVKSVEVQNGDKSKVTTKNEK